MSLMDTIRGAREEAQNVAASRAGTDKASKDADAEASAASSSSGGFSRRSTSRAKPSRKLAGSVNVATSSKTPEKEMTKEERKAARAEQRRKEDVVYDATQLVLKQQPGYEKGRRVWWITMGSGLACTAASWGIMQYVQSSGNQSAQLSVLAIALMVAAYALIIGGFIYDLVKVRPMRKRADEIMAGMSQKRMRKMLDEDERQKSKN